MVPLVRPAEEKKQSTAAAAPRTVKNRLPWAVGLVCVLLAAATVRVLAGRDELWQDEIWSLLAFARSIKSPLDVFTLHHDNNHYLITLWMYFVGAQQRDWFIYRIPSLVAGVGTVALAGLAARRWGDLAALTATIFTGASYTLIVYASEARGYALAGFFALAAYLALERFLATRSAASNALFIVACALGFLAHLTFIQFYFGASLWSLVACLRPRAMGVDRQSAARRAAAPKRVVSSMTSRHVPWAFRRALVDLLRLHVVPICTLAALYLLDVRAMRVGGGDDYVMRDVLLRTAGIAVGVATQSQVALFAAAILAGAVAAAALIALARERSDVWIFFAATIFVAPALLLSFRRPTLLYERYFYLNILFFLLFASYLLSRLFQLGRLGRSSAIAALGAFLAGNLLLTGNLLHVGRGHYLDALRYIESGSSEPELHLAGDDEFDNKMYLVFYVAYLPEGSRITYHDFHRPSADIPEWIVLHGQAQPYEPPASLRIPGVDGTYALARIFPCAPLSGYNFAVYRRESAASGEEGGRP
jgi:hypothetical protein